VPDSEKWRVIHTQGLTSKGWEALLDRSGRVRDGVSLFQSVLGGGVAVEVRPVVWPFLLGCYPLESTSEQQEHAITECESSLSSLTRQLDSEGAASRFAEGGADEELAVAIRRISLDVERTDPTLLSGDARTTFLSRLGRLLAAYALLGPEIGYCQGTRRPFTLARHSTTNYELPVKNDSPCRDVRLSHGKGR
jgi:hypothetical protein